MVKFFVASLEEKAKEILDKAGVSVKKEDYPDDQSSNGFFVSSESLTDYEWTSWDSEIALTGRGSAWRGQETRYTGYRVGNDILTVKGVCGQLVYSHTISE